MVPRAIAALGLLVGTTVAHAQQARPAAVAIESVAAVDETTDLNGTRTTGVMLDSVVSIGLGARIQGIVRPYVQRLASGEWNRQVWVAAIRYERPGAVGLRVDAGLIPSPVGMANLTLRPHLNPTIAQPSSLFTPLPPLEPRGARSTLLGAVYPYGAQVTVSGTHWDGRGAVIDTSPLRSRRIFSQTNPPRFGNVVLGGGVTPVVGVRVGGSISHGGWQQAGESPSIVADRAATVITVESELAFRHTKLTAEWVHDELDTSTGRRIASGWFAQGQHTVTPRWFAAGRFERMSAPSVLWLTGPSGPPSVIDLRFTGVEETVGYRLTPEITVRASHRARRGFGQPAYVHTAAVSMVWWKRWM